MSEISAMSGCLAIGSCRPGGTLVDQDGSILVADASSWLVKVVLRVFEGQMRGEVNGVLLEEPIGLVKIVQV